MPEIFLAGLARRKDFRLISVQSFSGGLQFMGRKLEFNRQKALQKVMESFWAKGYEETSMRDLAEKLGLHLGSVYNALGPKEKVFEEALRLHFDNHVLPHLLKMMDHADPVAAITDFVDEVARECSSEDKGGFGCFIVNSLCGITRINDGVTAFLHETIFRTEEAFAFTIARGQKSGSIDGSKDARKLARFVVAMLFSMRTLCKIGVSDDKVRDIRDCVMDTLKP
jgi:TetR/AcrR family transcriptional regulator, transcriptional repressor for nem operon